MTKPKCAWCGDTLSLVTVNHPIYEDVIIGSSLTCLDCFDLDRYADSSIDGSTMERWKEAMAENERLSIASQK